MHLKSIELENFKSFGGKVSIPLMDGYMAVTGPNGSGKSNIGDAIMFVLGPRSPKAVRAARIPDLVFSAAGKGKASYMKATLVFDNADRVLPWDADEVRLTRYIKLKGENKDDYDSFFYINDQSSKLSEFEALLAKARISADGYNIVQQGDVTHIIQMGAVERRRILDGISGIASYDADLAKAATERTDAQASLDRVSIIRTEKASQLTVLEKEKAEAQRWNEAQDRLNAAKAQLSVRQRDNEKAASDSFQEQIEEDRMAIADLESRKQSKESERADNDSAIASKEKEIADRTGDEYVRVKREVEDAKVALGTERNIRETKIESAVEKEQYSAEIDEKISECVHQRSELQQTLADLKDKLNSALRDKIAAMDVNNSITESLKNQGGEITAVQTRIQELEKSIDAKNATWQDADTRAATAASVAETADVVKNQAADAIEAARFDFKNAESEYTEITRSVADSDVEKIGKEIFDLNARERQLSKEETELRDIYNRKNAQFNKAQMEERVSAVTTGGGAGYNAILAAKASGQIKGIHGPICSLATVKSGFETAAGVAVGGKGRAIVVDDDAVGAACIKYLRENRIGRGTFLPLTKMQPGRPSAKAIMVAKQTLGYMTDFLEYDPKYVNVMWYAFGDTLVARDLDGARQIMGAVRIVTKEGDLIDKSGAMTGGTVDTKAIVKFGSTGADGSQLSSLGKEVEAASAALASATDALRVIRDQIREADERLRVANKSGAEVQGRIAAAKVKMDAARGALGKAEADVKRTAEDAQKAHDSASKAQAAAAVAANDLQNARDELARYRVRLGQLAPADIQERAENARNAVFEATNRESQVTLEVQSTEGEILAISNQITDYEDQKTKAVQAAAGLRAEAADKDAVIEKLVVELDAKEAIRVNLESGQEALRSERDALMERKFNLNSEIEGIKKDLEMKGGIMESHQASLQASQQKLAVFQKEVDAIVGEVPVDTPSEDTIKKSIHAAEGELAALGTVNLNAIQQYDDVLYTVNQIDAQVQKLNDQIQSLVELEAKISAEKKGIFMKAFDSIDTNFKQLFKELSGGGEVSMTLEDPEDPFNGGLFINAKPRNGMMLRLEALSGGEKSLTALAFIFAIQQYMPSPFYVLDEVDMFLDAVNTELVATHIKTLSAHTQFIQVSLRKVALTKADNLIGVTRPPSGISKVIMQVDMASLDELEAEAQKRQKESQNSS